MPKANDDQAAIRELQETIEDSTEEIVEAIQLSESENAELLKLVKRLLQRVHKGDATQAHEERPDG